MGHHLSGMLRQILEDFLLKGTQMGRLPLYQHLPASEVNQQAPYLILCQSFSSTVRGVALRQTHPAAALDQRSLEALCSCLKS
jgi:hypothetical protein